MLAHCIKPVVQRWLNRSRHAGHSARSIKSLLVRVVVMSTLPILLLVMITLSHCVYLLVTQVETNLREVAHSSSENIDDYLMSLTDTLRILSGSPSLESIDLEAFYEEGRRVLQARNDSLDNIILVRNHPVEQVLDLRLPYRLQKIAPVDCHEAVGITLQAKRPVVSDLFVSRASGNKLLAVTVPVLKHGQVTYVITAFVRPAILSRSIQRHDHNLHWPIIITDRKGTLLFEDDRHDNTLASEHRDIGMHNSRESQRLLPTYLNPNRLIVVEHVSKLSGWKVTVAGPRAAIFTLDIPLLVMLTIGGALIAIGCIAALFYAKRMTDSLNVLTESAAKVGGEEALSLVPTAVREINQVNATLSASHREIIHTKRLISQSEDRLKLAIQGGRVGLWEYDFRTGEIFCSDISREILGVSRDIPVTTEMIRSICDPADLEIAAQYFTGLCHDPFPSETILRARLPNGAIRWIRIRGFARHNHARELISLHGVMVDRTQTKSTAEQLAAKDNELRERYAELDSLYKSLPLGVAYVNEQLRFVRVNKKLADLNGLDIESHVGRSLAEVVPQFANFLSGIYQQIFQTKRGLEGIEFCGRTNSDSSCDRYWLANYAPVLLPDGSVKGACCAVLDITERKATETALNESAARLQSLSRYLLDLQEQVKSDIAKDLHDHLGQSLTGLKYLIETIAMKAGSITASESATALSVITDLIVATRSLALNLRPSMLDDLGLADALSWLIADFTKQTGIRIAADIAGISDGKRFSPHVETVAFRVIQESLTNIARYANVRDAEVSLGIDQEWLKITISDQGVGFNTDALQRATEHLGLAGMRERVASVNGLLEIISAPGRGTQIVARLPLTGDREESPVTITARTTNVPTNMVRAEKVS